MFEFGIGAATAFFLCLACGVMKDRMLEGKNRLLMDLNRELYETVNERNDELVRVGMRSEYSSGRQVNINRRSIN